MSIIFLLGIWPLSAGAFLVEATDGLLCSGDGVSIGVMIDSSEMYVSGTRDVVAKVELDFQRSDLGDQTPQWW